MLLLCFVFITWYHSLQTFVLEAYLPIPGTQNMTNQTVQTPQYRRLINQLQEIILLADHHIMVRNLPSLDMILTSFSFSCNTESLRNNVTNFHSCLNSYSVYSSITILNSTSFTFDSKTLLCIRKNHKHLLCFFQGYL